MLVVFKMTNDTPGNRHKPELSERKQWSYEKVLSWSDIDRSLLFVQHVIFKTPN